MNVKPIKIIRWKNLQHLLGGISRSTVDRWEAKGEFPKRINLGSNIVGWYLKDIELWIESRPYVEITVGLNESTN